MNQKDRILFVLEAIIKGDNPSKEFIVKKLRESFDLARPEVMLSPESRKEYNKIVKEAIKEGKIPFSKVD